jgi:hypothetical protein
MIEKIVPTVYKGESIYKTGAGGGGGGGDLPAGYTRANYARSAGSVSLVFTDLNVNYNDKYVIEIDLQVVQMGSLGLFARTNAMNLYADTGSISDLLFLPRYSYNNGTLQSANWLDYSRGGLIKVTYNKRYCVIDYDQGNYHKTINRNSSAPDDIIDELKLFSFNIGANVYPFNGSIYSFKIFDKDDANKLNADFVPCYDSNNVLGFYEKISGQFQGDVNLIE